MSDVDCPYCGEGQEICHDDGQGYEEGVLHEQECGACDKTFTFTTSISFHYEPRQADCLNDGDHDWQMTYSFPVECTKMRCSTCGKTRLPDESEWTGISKARAMQG